MHRWAPVLLLLIALAEGPAAAPGEAFPAPEVVAASATLQGTYDPAASDLPWQAGQVHAHLAPHSAFDAEGLATAYLRLGLSFAVLTEHDAVGDPPVVPGFLFIPGTEVSFASGGRAAHITGLGVQRAVDSTGDDHQAAVDDILGQGGIPVMAHPGFHGIRGTGRSWSIEDAAALQGVAAIEVYNHIAAVWSSGDPTGFPHLFAALRTGRQVWAVAADDPHVLRTEQHGASVLGHGYIVVQTPRSDEASVLGAIREGRMVAVATPSAGPPAVWPGLIELRERTVTVTSAIGRPAAAIEVFDASGDRRALAAGPEASYTVSGDEGFLLVVFRGEDGSVVILQPIRVHGGSDEPALEAPPRQEAPAAPVVWLLAAVLVLAARRR